MPPNPSNRAKQLRQRIAMEAARLMDEHGISDFHTAKRKAAARLGVSDGHSLPRNVEVEAALAEYHRIFQSQSQPRRLKALRRAALEAMAFFREFSPRLVGSVLRGTAGEHSDVNLHLFADAPETLNLFLEQHHIPYEQRQRRMRHAQDQLVNYPVYRFMAGDVPIDITLFPLAGLREAPLSPVDGRPMRRASAAAVRELMEADEYEIPPAQ